MRRTPELEAVLLGLVQGLAELVPVSSSAHVAAAPWLLGWEVAGWPPERRKELEVALHAGALTALAGDLWRARPAPAVLALSLAPPVLAGWAFEEPVQERLGGPGALAAGLLAGAAALVAADGWGTRRRAAEEAGVRDGVALGLAQAAALVPGVSRSGATLAAARARGFARPEASRLSVVVSGPVLTGATALKAWRVAARRPPARQLRPVAAGAVAAFASTRAARRAVGLERRRPLWPWAVERAALAVAILAVRENRRR